LREKTKEFQQRLKNKESLDDILPEAFAVVREAAKRTLGQRHFDVQLLGGIVLHRGEIAEMKTGEGKTLAATLPVYLNALTGKGVHIVTVNDYLAKRDASWMGPIYHLLGLTVGCIQHEEAYIFSPEKENLQPPYNLQPELVSRKQAYEADILYGTNNEFGFDYLRDNMVYSLEERVQRGLNYAIVDEVDSILIDEARTPLIISGPAERPAQMYYQFSRLVKTLKENEDYNVDEKMKAATLTEKGISKIEKALGMENIYTQGGLNLVHHLEQALKAETLFHRDRDYVVKNGEVIIVDEFTGRLMYGRRYSEGLHQALEAKEGLEIKRESITLATITFQNYFRLYKKLAGMTGTAVTSAEEFHKVYGLEVVVIPTNKPMIREDKPDVIYKTEKAKFKAIVEEIKTRHKKGQPILVGTISIEKNEILSEMLEKEGIPHQVLNAKHHEKEAAIIAQAGRLGAVTVATNMAGRGVDIILGGKPPEDDDKPKIREWQKEHNQVIALGGLHVIGTERHEARRIDNQLRGRAGRQGDPGSSQFYVSLEDDLMRIFGSERIKNLMDRLGLPEDTPIEHKMISKAIEEAQKKVEGYNFDLRKHLLEYDDVINKHREVIYKKRHEILKNSKSQISNLKSQILKMIENEIEQIVSFHTASENEKDWNLEEIYEVVGTIFPLPKEARIKLENIQEEAGDVSQDTKARTKIIRYLINLAHKSYDELERKIVSQLTTDSQQLTIKNPMREVEKRIMLQAIDNLWIEHLETMDHLRTGIGLRAYGQREPLIEYKKEAYRAFNELLNLIQKQVVYSIYKIGLAVKFTPSVMPLDFSQSRPSQIKLTAPAKTMNEDIEQPLSKSVRDKKKIGRNDPCPCGSGKKYKKCHGR
jgi:preprotein translocase subunit SecA